MNIVVIYPGRFQPFGPHHAKVWLFLTSMFGPNVYIATTNNTKNIESPFNFQEKCRFIEEYIPKRFIKLVTNPYKAEEILENYDLSDTKVIFAYSAKDAGRISYTKINGEPGYLQPFISIDSMEMGIKHSYILVTPEYKIKFKGKDLSGTYLRQLLKDMKTDPNSTMNKQMFKKLFGFYDSSFYNNILKKV